MSGDKGASFPIAAIGVVALLASAAFLGPHAYNLLRLADSDTAKQGLLLQPPVEARLWEDPLAALVRHRAKFKERCTAPPAKPADPSTTTWAALRTLITRPHPDAMCDGAAEENKEALSRLKDQSSDLTVIAVLLPGADFLGVEEARRRTRYAVLTGLAAEGFVPDNSERLGFYSTDKLCDKFSACAKTFTIDVVYETLTRPDDDKEHHAVVLWINDVAVGQPWLSRLTLLLKEVAPPPERGRLRIIGPGDSDKLINVLDSDISQMAKQAKELSDRQSRDYFPFLENWAILTRITLVSPWSTTSAESLRDTTQRKLEARIKGTSTGQEKLPLCDTSGKIDCVDEIFRSRLRQIADALRALPPEDEGVPDPPAPFFVRTISTDDRQVALLVSELCARNAVDKEFRVVLLHEWDSIYARDFADSLAKQLEKAPCGQELTQDVIREKIKAYSFLRGIDGANLDGATREVRLVPRAAGDKGRDTGKDPAIEWPESRDQRDYVRRLARDIHKEAEAANQRVASIGIFGIDVHDKLVLAQALRETFPDGVFFTTDLDARLMHPEVLTYTRNMVVASSLPLVSSDLKLGKDPSVRVPPFRDSYQTATFLGARYAVSTSSDEAADQLGVLLSEPRLYEIGRQGEVRLGITDTPREERRDRRFFALVSASVLVVLAWVILVARPGPAMRQALRASPRISQGFSLATVVLCLLTTAGLGFGLGVVLALGTPEQIGPGRILLLTVLAAVLFFATVYPGSGPVPADVYAADKGAVRIWSRWQRVMRLEILLPLGVAAWAFLPPCSAPEACMREPFGAANGVSAWPSELLRTLALVLFPWFLDWTWNSGREAAERVGKDFFGVGLPPPRLVQLPVLSKEWPRHLMQLARHPGEWPARTAAGWRRGRQLMQRWQARREWWLRRFAHRSMLALSAASLWLWNPKEASAGYGVQRKTRKRVDGRRLWKALMRLLHNGPRFGRLVVWLVITAVVVSVIVAMLGGQWPKTTLPVRGPQDRALFWATNVLAVCGALILLILVSNAAVLTYRFILIMKTGRTIYPPATVNRFAAELGIAEDPALQATDGVASPAPPAYFVAADPADRKPGAVARNSLFDPWIDARFMAQHTAALGPLIFFPFILLGLLIVARSRVFDNWEVGAVIVVLGSYLLWAAAMAALLNFGAEIARRKAIEDLEKDLLWMKGAGPNYKALAEQFPRVIEQVRNLREGAFAPFFEQPVVRAILLPLGGAGGIQLMETFMLARG